MPIRITLSLLVTALSLLPAATAWAQQEAGKMITIEADEWCPINCDSSGVPQGVGIDLAKKIFEPLGYRVRYVVVPWSQALKDVRTGLADAAVGANRTDDPRLLFPDNAITTISDDFYVRKGDPWRYQGDYTLKGKRLGVIEDYGYGDVIKNYVAEHKKERNTITIATGNEALRANINHLTAGRIDVIVESRVVMEYWLQKLNMQNKIEWAGSIPQDKVYLAFSPALASSKDLMRRYDAGIQQLRKSGQLEAIYKPYGMKP